ncbi:MAG: alpha/beta hydrolase [Bacteroidota bacterium]
MLQWTEHLFSFQEGEICGKSCGNGRRLLLCMHGYMQDRHLFDQVFDEVPSDWQILSLDLPLFGKSCWDNLEQAIDVHFLQKLLEAIRQCFQPEAIHLLGFSMGGEVAMRMLMHDMVCAPWHILIAPVGIRPNRWHAFIRRNPIGKALLQFLFHNPSLVIGLSRMSEKLGFIDRGTARFVRANFSSEKNRQLLYGQLNIYQLIQVRFSEFIRLVKQKPIQWIVIWGKEDEVMPSHLVYRMGKYLDHVDTHLVNGPHRITDVAPQAVGEIVKRYMQDMVSEQ